MSNSSPCYIISLLCLLLSSLLDYVPFSEQEKAEVAKKRDVEGMGVPEIKYGESMCFVQHVSTGLWVTYAALDAKAARLGTMKRKVQYKQMTLMCYNCCATHLRPLFIVSAVHD